MSAISTLMLTTTALAILFSMFTTKKGLKITLALNIFLLVTNSFAFQEFQKPIKIEDAYAQTLIGSISGHGKTLVSYTPKLPSMHYYLFDYQTREVTHLEGRALGNLLPKLFLTETGFGVLDPFKKKLILLGTNLVIQSKEALRNYDGHREEVFYRAVSPLRVNQALISTWDQESKTLGFAKLDLTKKSVEQLFNFDPDEAKKGNYWGYDGEALYYFDQTYRLVEVWDLVTFERKKSLLPKRDPVINKMHSPQFSSPFNTQFHGQIRNAVFTNIGILLLEDIDLDPQSERLTMTAMRMLSIENQKALIQPFGPVKVGEWEGVQLIFDMDTGDFSFKEP